MYLLTAEIKKNNKSCYSGGGTCHRHKNRALGDTFLKFGMVLEQAMSY